MREREEFTVEDEKGWHFTPIENEILDQTEHFKKVYDKMVYIAISRFKNINTKEAYPSIKRLAKMCFCSENAVRDSIKRLEELGLIKVIRVKDENGNNNKPNIYRLLPIPKLLKGTSSHEVGVLHDMKGGTSHGEDELEKVNEKKLNDGHNKNYDENSSYFKMAKYLLEKILEWKPNLKRPNLQSWSDDFRKMVELDNRTKEEIKVVIDFATTDDFWQINILSASKLRKQFDQIQAKANKKIGQAKKKTPEEIQEEMFLKKAQLNRELMGVD